MVTEPVRSRRRPIRASANHRPSDASERLLSRRTPAISSSHKPTLYEHGAGGAGGPEYGEEQVLGRSLPGQDLLWQYGDSRRVRASIDPGAWISSTRAIPIERAPGYRREPRERQFLWLSAPQRAERLAVVAGGLRVVTILEMTLKAIIATRSSWPPAMFAAVAIAA